MGNSGSPFCLRMFWIFKRLIRDDTSFLTCASPTNVSRSKRMSSREGLTSKGSFLGSSFLFEVLDESFLCSLNLERGRIFVMI